MDYKFEVEGPIGKGNLNFPAMTDTLQDNLLMLDVYAALVSVPGTEVKMYRDGKEVDSKSLNDSFEDSEDRVEIG
jgi:hypothetical protein